MLRQWMLTPLIYLKVRLRYTNIRLYTLSEEDAYIFKMDCCCIYVEIQAMVFIKMRDNFQRCSNFFMFLGILAYLFKWKFYFVYSNLFLVRLYQKLLAYMRTKESVLGTWSSLVFDRWATDLRHGHRTLSECVILATFQPIHKWQCYGPNITINFVNIMIWKLLLTLPFGLLCETHHQNVIHI